MRVSPPNHTQVPNDLFDHWLPLLNESELKVLLVIIRKTFGWHKTHDIISLSQIEKITGLAKANVCKGIKSLEEKGVISKHISGVLGREQVSYGLVIAEESNKSDQYSCDTRGGIDKIPGGVSQEYPQKNSTKEQSKHVHVQGVNSVPVQESELEQPQPKNPQGEKDKHTKPKPDLPQEKKGAIVYECLKRFPLSDKEKQLLTRQFSEFHIENAIEDAKWFEKNGNPITNLMGLLKSQAKKSKEKHDNPN